VIASRYAPGGKTENPWLLIVMSHMVNVIFRLVLGLNCLDVSNSFRLYRGDDLRKLRLECRHFDIVEEILVKLSYSRHPYRIKEVPSTFEKRKAGKTKRQLLTFAIGYVGTLWRLLSLKRKVAAESR
jgi:dolichol-phosphate mannosyltransferase